MNTEEQKEYQEKMGSPEMEYLQYQLENPQDSPKCIRCNDNGCPACDGTTRNNPSREGKS